MVGGGDRDRGRGAGHEPTMPAEPGAPATDVEVNALPLPARLVAGMVLGGRFEILERLGEGGAGAVYAARDRLIGEEVALKVLHERIREGAGLGRLRDEIRAGRRIAHANVCRVYDLVVDGGVVFLVMELLRGETLRRRVRRALPVAEAVEIVRQLGGGLAAAHR